jgi:hypothetical protein
MFSINGGTPQVSNLFTVNAPGTYTIQVTDSIGCKATKTVTANTLSATFAAAKTAICYGASVKATVTAVAGAAPYQYSLNGGTYKSSPVFTLTAGSYTVQVKDAAGCALATNTISVTQPAAALGINVSVTNASCRYAADGSIIVTGSGGYGSYQYNLNGGAYQAAGLFTGLTVGSDFVTVRDGNGCVTSNTKVRVNQSLTPCPPRAAPSKVVPVLQLAVKTYPNPSPDGFTLTLQGGDSKYRAVVMVRDVYGHAVYQTTGSIFDTYRFGSSFTGGVYLVEVRNGNMAQTVKVVKGK